VNGCIAGHHPGIVALDHHALRHAIVDLHVGRPGF
jgi:hypothetical protein